MLVAGAMVQLGLNNSAFLAGIASSSRALSGLNAGSAFLALGAGAAIAGAAAVKMAGDFQQGMTTLVTGAGESERNLGLVAQGVLKLSTVTGQTTGQLIAGMFQIESAGYRGASGLQVLQTAAEGARVGNADLGTVANAVTTVMKDYGISATHSADAMNFLTAIVQNGKTTLQDLAASMSQVLPTASAVGVHLTDVGAAMATMTAEGVPAANAATYLRQLLISLTAPAKAGAGAFAAIGLTVGQVSTEMKQSLPGALQLIMTHLAATYQVGSPQYIAALKNIAGGSKQMQGMLDLTGSHLAELNANMKNVAGTMQQGHGQVVGWAQAQGDFNLQLDRAKQTVAALFIELGTKLLPVLTPLVTQVTSGIAAFGGWITAGGALSPIFSNIAGMFGVMAANWGDFLGQLQASLGGPLAQFGQLMGSLLPGFLSQFLRALTLVQLAFQSLAPLISSIVRPALQLLGQTFRGIQNAIEPVLNAIEGNLLPALQNLIGAVAPVVAGILQWVAASGIIPALWNAIGAAVSFVVNVVSLLVNIGAALITFFTQTALGSALFKAILITVAAVVLPLLIVMIYSLVTAFVAWAAAAIAVGIANLIAFAPIILVALVIIAIITGIILLVTHWGQVMTWLGNLFGTVFGAIGSLVGRVFSAIGTFVHTALLGIATFFVNKWNDMLAFVKSIPGKILQALSTLAGILLAPFRWFYDHNIYVKAAVDLVVKLFDQLKTAVGGAFSAIGTTIRNALTTTKNQVGGAFSAIGTTIREVLTGIKNTVGGAFDAIGTTMRNKATDAKNVVGGAFSAMGTVVRDKVTDLKNTVGGAFSAIGTVIHAKITDAWNWLTGFVSGWPKTAFNWGINLLKMLAQGIVSGIGSVINSIVQLGQRILAFLGFHSPPSEGPLASSGQWMPNFIKMLAQGVVSGIGTMLSAIGQLAGSVLGALRQLAGHAFSAGASIVKNIAGGILSNIGSAIGGAMSAVGGFIHDHLPHSPAKRGPLRDLPVQSAMIGQQIATGILSGIPSVQAAMGRLLAPALVVSSTGTSASVSPVSSSGGGRSREIHIHQHWNGREISHEIVNDMGDALVHHIRLKKGTRS